MHQIIKNSDRPLKGILLSTQSTEIVESLKKTGLDWIFIDEEHSALSLRDMQNLVMAAGSDLLSFIRVANPDTGYIKRALDTGCDGIIVPQVNTKEEALSVVRAAKYPPLGIRSVGLARAQGYGLNLKKAIETANESVSLIVQIEHKDAVENLEDILSVKGIDGIFIGPYDLSCSLGIPGDVQAKDVQDRIQYTKETAKNYNIPWGIFCGTADAAKKEMQDGAAFVAVGSDILLLNKSVHAMVESLG